MKMEWSYDKVMDMKGLSRFGCYILGIFLLNGLWMPTSYGADSFVRYKKITLYDNYFRKYSKRNFGPGFDWAHFKSQAIAESGLKKNAKSHVGAVGVMQIMPATYNEIIKKSPHIKGDSNHPKWNIAAGIYYNRNLWNTFKAKRPFQDKLDFMYASYNAGKGNVIKAQRIAKKRGLNPNIWPSIEKTLPQVTGKNSRETIHYIKKIRRITKDLKHGN